jgi:hypothetical protein
LLAVRRTIEPPLYRGPHIDFTRCDIFTQEYVLIARYGYAIVQSSTI